MAHSTATEAQTGVSFTEPTEAEDNAKLLQGAFTQCVFVCDGEGGGDSLPQSKYGEKAFALLRNQFLALTEFTAMLTS
jgi:hypothetical protein